MKFRTFQGTEISEVGLGTWQLGGSEWGDLSEGESMEILETYINNGGNFIDTADIYGGGRSEELIGRYLENSTQEIYVATKLGRREDNGYGWPTNFTYDTMKKHVIDSLERLSVSSLFLEQLHCIPKEHMVSGEVFKHLERIREEGLIRHWGASVETIEEALICLEYDGLASLQVIFNIFRQHTADELFEKAAEKGVEIIARVPLASGLLTGKFDESTTFTENDHRNFNADGEAFNVGETFSGLPFKQGVKMSRKVERIVDDIPLPQASLRWILDHPEVTTVIPGASSPAQVESNTAASDMHSLSSEVHRKLRKLYDDEIRSAIRGEV